jgi:hypothetical protein
MQQAFDCVRLPDEVCGKTNVHIRIALDGNSAVSGALLSDNPSGGELAVNDIFVYDEAKTSKNGIDKSYTQSGEKINISVQNNTQQDVNADIYTAVYGSDNVLKKLFKKENIQISSNGEYTDSQGYEYTLNSGDRVVIFCWESGTMKPCE